jgi:ferredoxin-NADP reductase
VTVAANPKRLRIVGARWLGARTRALAVECIEGGAFERAGGKYVIVHTGVVFGEKAVKRAYSLVPVQGGPHTYELVVKRLDGGPGSQALHGAPVGTELGFSGPWGKLVPEGGLGPRALLLATDTGITSALGIVEQHAKELAEVLWLREADDPFLDARLVRARVEQAGARFVTAAIPEVSAPQRAAAAHALVDARVRELSPSLVIATGDGRVVHPLVERLCPTETRIECYFHNPEKKSAT